MACHPAVSLTRLTAALAALAFLSAGCGTGSSISDSKIATALELKRVSGGYEMGGDPFCAIEELLNDADEVDEASQRGGETFVIAGPSGEVGVLARRPFAPDCARRARSALKRLERKFG